MLGLRVAGQIELFSKACGGQQQVALRVRRHRVQGLTEGVAAQRRDPCTPRSRQVGFAVEAIADATQAISKLAEVKPVATMLSD